MSNPGYAHSHINSQGQATGGSESAYANGHVQHNELARTSSAVSQHPRALPPLPASAKQTPGQEAAQKNMTSDQAHAATQSGSTERGRKRGRNDPVDWASFYGGKPPAEIIVIHDDDSPAPTIQVQKLPPPTNGTSESTARHVDKRRRTEGGNGDAQYSTTNTPYSLSNGTSTESLRTNTTAASSLASQASSSSRLDTTQTGQKRKRTTRTSDQEKDIQIGEKTRSRGYLAEYGDYVPPAKHLRIKKQKEVHVPTIRDVGSKTPIHLIDERS